MGDSTVGLGAGASVWVGLKAWDLFLVPLDRLSTFSLLGSKGTCERAQCEAKNISSETHQHKKMERSLMGAVKKIYLCFPRRNLPHSNGPFNHHTRRLERKKTAHHQHLQYVPKFADTCLSRGGSYVVWSNG